MLPRRSLTKNVPVADEPARAAIRSDELGQIPEIILTGAAHKM
jgi:hypothetical protein